MTRWQTQSSRTIEDLRADLTVARELIAAHQALTGRELHTPPPELVSAIREGRPHAHVDIDGLDVLIGLEPEVRRPDPLAETLDWYGHLEVHRSAREQWTVPGAVGLRFASLPVGHRYQAWRSAGSDIVIVAASLPHRIARAALRAALRALHVHGLILPLLCCLAR